MPTTRFAGRVAKVDKSNRGRTTVESTPIAIRSRVDLAPGAADRMLAQLASRLAPVATVIERGTVRFEDINGPKGGLDTLCRIKLVLSGFPSVQVEETAENADKAFGLALSVLTRTFRRFRDKHDLRPGKHHRHRPRPARGIAEPVIGDTGRDDNVDAGAVIGRRVGRGRKAVGQALARPEKRRRDAYVDTSLPGVSASDRRAGGDMTARRNTRKRTGRATAALEDSRTKPSRKSTRRSANRSKLSQGKERTALSQSITPSARAARATAGRR